MVLNAHHDAVGFTLPEPPDGDGWHLLVDTNVPEREGETPFRRGDVYLVTGRSLPLFVAKG